MLKAILLKIRFLHYDSVHYDIIAYESVVTGVEHRAENELSKDTP